MKARQSPRKKKLENLMVWWNLGLNRPFAGDFQKMLEYIERDIEITMRLKSSLD